MIGESCISSIQAANARGNPVKPIESDRNAAPIKIKAIIAEVRVAPMRLSKNAEAVKERWKIANVSEPRTPTAAASVAVAQPKYMEPMTENTNNKTGIKNRLSASISPKLILGSGGGR